MARTCAQPHRTHIQWVANGGLGGRERVTMKNRFSMNTWLFNLIETTCALHIPDETCPSSRIRTHSSVIRGEMNFHFRRKFSIIEWFSELSSCQMCHFGFQSLERYLIEYACGRSLAGVGRCERTYSPRWGVSKIKKQSFCHGFRWTVSRERSDNLHWPEGAICSTYRWWRAIRL